MGSSSPSKKPANLTIDTELENKRPAEQKQKPVTPNQQQLPSPQQAYSKNNQEVDPFVLPNNNQQDHKLPATPGRKLSLNASEHKSDSKSNKKLTKQQVLDNVEQALTVIQDNYLG